MAVTGASSYIQFGKEAVAWGTEAAAIATSFGRNLSLRTQSRNNFIKERGLGNRNVTAFIEGKFEGTLTVSGILADGHWLALFFGSASTASSAPYNHTIAEANTLPSITIEDGTDLATDSIRKYLGCMLDRVTIAIDRGDPIRFTADFFYKTETEASSGIDSSPATPVESSMNFAQASVDLPSASTLTNVTRIEIVMENNIIVEHACGSRFPAVFVPGERNYTINLVKMFENSIDLLEKFYGSTTAPNATVAETATCVVNVTNGLTAGNERHFAFTFTGCKIDTHDVDKKIGEVSTDNVPVMARSGGLVVQDATASTIFD